MAKSPRGVQTNGEKQITTAHLNLTRSLADVWGVTETPPEANRPTEAQKAVREGFKAGLSNAEIAKRAGIKPTSVPVLASRMGLRRPPKARKPVVVRRPPYAGYDKTERQWQ